MTQRFILDENVVILAQKGENNGEERDSTCLRLIAQIIAICHTLVVDHSLWVRYQRQLSVISSDSQIGVSIVSLLANAFRTENKVELRSDASSFPGEDRIPAGSQDDVEIVRLAVASGATLVTTDEPLREALSSTSIQETYNFQVMSPAEVLADL